MFTAPYNKHGQLKISRTQQKDVIYLIPRGLVFPQNILSYPAPRGVDDLHLKTGVNVIKVTLRNPQFISIDDEAVIFSRRSKADVKNDLTRCKHAFFWKKVDLGKLLSSKEKLNQYVVIASQDIALAKFDDLVNAATERRNHYRDWGVDHDFFSLFDVLKANKLYSSIFGILDVRVTKVMTSFAKPVLLTDASNIILHITPSGDDYYHYTQRAATSELVDSLSTAVLDDDDQLELDVLKLTVNASSTHFSKRLQERAEEVKLLADKLQLQDNEVLQLLPTLRKRGVTKIILADKLTKELSVIDSSEITVMEDKNTTKYFHTSRSVGYYKSVDKEVVAILNIGYFVDMIVITRDPDILTALFSQDPETTKVTIIDKLDDLAKVINTTGAGVLIFKDTILPTYFQPEAKDFVNEITEVLLDTHHIAEDF